MESDSAQSDNDSTRENCSKLNEGRFRLEVRRKLFTQRELRYWNRLLRDLRDAPSLELIKSRLDEALGNLIS